jgi:hypothetical protein
MSESLPALCAGYLQVLHEFPRAQPAEVTERFLNSLGELLEYDFAGRFAYLEACRIVLEQTPRRWGNYGAKVRAAQQELYFASVIGLVDLEAKLHQHPEPCPGPVEHGRSVLFARLRQLGVAVNDYWARWMELQTRSSS